MLPGKVKTKEQLMNELAGLRKKIAELETLETERKEAEERLRESEEQFRRLFEQSNDAVFIHDFEGRLLNVNDAASKMLGYSKDELLRMPITTLHPEAELTVSKEAFQTTMKKGSVRFETKFRKSDGTIIDVDISSRIVDRGKEVIQGIVRDITERKQAEATQRLQSEITANMSEGVYLVRASDGLIVYTNPKFEEIFGYESGEMVGKHVSIVNDPAVKNPEEVSREIMGIMDRTGVWSGEIQNIKKDGTPFWCYASVSYFLHPEHGKVLVAVHTDITERKQAEEEIKESEEKFRDLYENAPNAYFSVGVDGHIKKCNRHAAELLGYKIKDIVGRPALELYASTPQGKEKASLIFQRFKAGEKVVDEELQMQKMDGMPVWISLTVNTIRDTRGQVVESRSMVVDITERKRVEEEIRGLAKFPSENPNPVLRVAKDGTILYANQASLPLLNAWGCQTGQPLPKRWHKLILDGLSSGLSKNVGAKYEDHFLCLTFSPVVNRDYVNLYGLDMTERRRAEKREKELQHELYLSSRLAAVGELAAGVAHEINNPLTGIVGFSERLLRTNTDDKISGGLEMIHHEARRATKVIENLLTFARRRKTKKEYSDINDILGRTLELRTYELKTSNIKLAVKLTSNLPKVMVDFHQIQEVFLNIILNAEQVMNEANHGGKLSIKTEQIENYIRVSFTDDGPGIPAKQLDKIFDPFFTTRGEEGGTGLGLSVCHGIVIEHGGKIYAKSQPGKGTTFFVELPVATGE